jgi:hypothetical protein
MQGRQLRRHLFQVAGQFMGLCAEFGRVFHGVVLCLNAHFSGEQLLH